MTRIFRASVLAFVFFTGLAGLFASGAASADEDSIDAQDRVKIQAVISSQLRAFQRDDDVIAFSYTTPTVRRKFGSPQAFMAMVRRGYETLYHHRSTQFLEAVVLEGSVVQPVRIVTVDGEVIVALFTMEQQADEDWRVSGCEIAESTVQAA